MIWPDDIVTYIFTFLQFPRDIQVLYACKRFYSKISFMTGILFSATLSLIPPTTKRLLPRICELDVNALDDYVTASIPTPKDLCVHVFSYSGLIAASRRERVNAIKVRVNESFEQDLVWKSQTLLFPLVTSVSGDISNGRTLPLFPNARHVIISTPRTLRDVKIPSHVRHVSFDCKLVQSDRFGFAENSQVTYVSCLAGSQHLLSRIAQLTHLQTLDIGFGLNCSSYNVMGHGSQLPPSLTCLRWSADQVQPFQLSHLVRLEKLQLAHACTTILLGDDKWLPLFPPNLISFDLCNRLCDKFPRASRLHKLMIMAAQQCVKLVRIHYERFDNYRGSSVLDTVKNMKRESELVVEVDELFEHIGQRGVTRRFTFGVV